MLLLLLLHLYGASSICPGDPYTSKIPLYFGYMTSIDNSSSFVASGSIPAVDLALKLINENNSLLYGYELSYNDTIYDDQVSQSVKLIYN
jgi:gamma-aminobutyric acid type B receptor